MKKLTRKTLDELAKILPVVSKEEQRMCLGMGSGVSGAPYTESKMNVMLDSGTWNRGYVEGLGYVLQGVTVNGNSGQSGTTGGTTVGAVGAFIGSIAGSYYGGEIGEAAFR